MAYATDVWLCAGVPAHRMGPAPLEGNAMKGLPRENVRWAWRSAVAFLGLIATSAVHAAPAAAGNARATVVVVTGAPGEAEFAPDLMLQMEAWSKVAAQAEARHIAVGGNVLI